eukprot:2708010-Pyramimonas_sp.AAC.1
MFGRSDGGGKGKGRNNKGKGYDGKQQQQDYRQQNYKQHNYQEQYQPRPPSQPQYRDAWVHDEFQNSRNMADIFWKRENDKAEKAEKKAWRDS